MQVWARVQLTRMHGTISYEDILKKVTFWFRKFDFQVPVSKVSSISLLGMVGWWSSIETLGDLTLPPILSDHWIEKQPPKMFFFSWKFYRWERWWYVCHSSRIMMNTAAEIFLLYLLSVRSTGLGLTAFQWKFSHIEAETKCPPFSRRHFQIWILIKISLKFVPKGPINNIPGLLKIKAWRRPGDKPISEPIMVSLSMHICITRPKWVNIDIENFWKLDFNSLWPSDAI